MADFQRDTAPDLTPRQREVLDFITECIDARGFPPTLREIGSQFGIRSTNGVNDHLKALERKGYLAREDLKSRALRPTHAKPVVQVPLIGRVAAGQPVLAVENVESTFKLDQALIGAAGEHFALRVDGESMIEDGIFDGDIVFVRPQSNARAGETVVALVDDEATVKRFYPEGKRVRLQPANASMQPIYVDRDDGRDLRLLGVVVGVYRQLA